MLDEQGMPMPVQRTLIAPPRCRIGVLTPDERAVVRSTRPFRANYDVAINRESAYEVLARRASAAAENAGGEERDGERNTEPRPQPDATAARGSWEEILWGSGRRQGMVEAMAKQAARSIGGRVGRSSYGVCWGRRRVRVAGGEAGRCGL